MTKKAKLDKTDAITDLSPIITNFINNKEDKRLMIYPYGTGTGKSYSFNKFVEGVLSKSIKTKNFNKIIYITDRKNNLKQEYDKLQKLLLPALQEKTMIVYSNEDLILQNIDAFKHIEKPFRTNSYSKLYRYSKKINSSDYAINPEDKIENKRYFNDYYRDYMKEISCVLNEEFNKKNIKGDRHKLSYLEKNYPNFCRVFQNIYIGKKKVLFLNNDKFALPINTIIGGVVILPQDERYLKDSIVFLDESDASSNSFLDRIVEKSRKCEMDLIGCVYYLAQAIKETDLSAEHTDKRKTKNSIIRLKNEINVKYNEMLRYHILQQGKTLLDDSFNLPNRWMYVKADTSIVHHEGDKMRYIYYDKKDMKTVITATKPKNQKTVLKLDDFINELTELFNLEILLLKKLTDKEIRYIEDKNKEDKNYSTNSVDLVSASNKQIAIDSVLSSLKLDELKYNSALKEIITNFESLNGEAEDIDDSYLTPGTFSRISANELTETIKLYVINILSTPEKFLKNIVDCGSYVILSSATAANTSKFSNYALDWPALNKNIYEISEDETSKIIDYLKRRAKNIERTNMKISTLPRVENKDILGFFPTSSSRDKVTGLLENLEILCKDDETPHEMRDVDEESYRYQQLLSLLKAAIIFLATDSKFNLMLLSFNLDEKKLSIIKNIASIYTPNAVVYSAKSENLENRIDEFKKELSDKNKLGLFMTSYQTFEKGYSCEFEIDSKDYPNEIFAINASKGVGDAQLIEGLPVSVDFSGLYLGDITHNEPSIEFCENAQEEISEMIKSAYYGLSVYKGDPMNQNRCIGYCLERNHEGRTKYPFSFAKNDEDASIEFRKSQSETLLKTLEQSIGRTGRCNFRFKTKRIIINESIISRLKKSKTSNIKSRKYHEFKSYDVKKVFDFIEESMKTINQEGFNKRGRLEKSTSIMESVLAQKAEKNHIEYKILKDNAKEIFLSDSQHQALPPLLQTQYIKIKEGEGQLVQGYRYVSEKSGYYGTNIVTNGKIYPIDSVNGNKVVSIPALCLTNEQHKCAQKFGFLQNLRGEIGGYVITPSLFYVLIGNISELFYEKVYAPKKLGIINDFKAPDEDIYERVDFIHTKYSKDFVIAVDCKHNSFLKEEFDTQSEKEPIYMRKLNDIYRHYKKPVKLLIINTRLNETGAGYEITKRKTKNGEIIIAPNIYSKEGKLSSEIANQIIDLLNK